MKIDSFVIAIILTVIVAFIFPQFGNSESKIPLDMIASVGVSMIFFFYGLKLTMSKLKAGLSNWRLHILIQLTTFLVFPLLVIVANPLLTSGNDHTIWLAFLFLAALPSTVSSSVVMVSMAKGNVTAAIFNASISGLIGIMVTPIWMSFFVKNETVDFDLSTIYFNLIIGVLLPVILGLLLQKWGERFVTKFGKQLSTFDKCIILIIIYKSFAESFENNVFSSVGLVNFLKITMGVFVLFYVVYYFVGWMSKKLNFNQEDQITAQFCGTKKSLVHGTVFSEILFTGIFPMGIILLPLMLFHGIQIFIISIIASKLGRRS